MDISYKYSYIAKTMLMTFLYVPIFPLGVIFSLLGLILGYILERFNFTHLYKRPEMLNQKMCEFYVNYFIVFLFDYGIGNWMFMSETFPIKDWALVNIILFGLLIIIPYPHLFHCKFIEESESEINTKEYKDVYFSFYNDYERQNPLTKKQGLSNYLKRLLDDGKINRRTYSIAKRNIDNLNIMQMYYHSTLSSNLIQTQKALANFPFNNIKSKSLGFFIQKTILDQNNNKDSALPVNEGINTNNNYNTIKLPSLDEQILLAFGAFENENNTVINEIEDNNQQMGNSENINNNGYNNVIKQYNNPFLMSMGYEIGFPNFIGNYYMNEYQGNNFNNNYMTENSLNQNNNNIVNPNFNQTQKINNINNNHNDENNNQGYFGGGGYNLNNNNNNNNDNNNQGYFGGAGYNINNNMPFKSSNKNNVDIKDVKIDKKED